MKTYNNLYTNIYDFENLMLAAQKSQRGKRFEPNVMVFNHNLEGNLFRLQRELIDGTYKPGKYFSFHIHEPKKRMISAAPYRDRVVHHALCNVIEPIYEKTFICDSYACRKGKGTHKAILRFSEYCRNNKYALKCDIKKYFPSIDHEILKSLIRRKIACKQTLVLIDRIIDNSNEQEVNNEYFPEDLLFTPWERRKGIPIGNLTSQFFANIYLNGLDHFVKEILLCPRYIRYCDDFVLFSDDKTQLNAWRKEIMVYLQTLRLKMHENKAQAAPVETGVTFLGLRIFPAYRRLAKNNLVTARRRFKRLKKALLNGETDMASCRNSIMAWFGHAQWADTYELRRQIAAEWGLA